MKTYEIRCIYTYRMYKLYTYKLFSCCVFNYIRQYFNYNTKYNNNVKKYDKIHLIYVILFY